MGEPKFPGNHNEPPDWVTKKDSEMRATAVENRLNAEYAKRDQELVDRTALLPKWLRSLIQKSPSASAMALATVLSTASQIDEPLFPDAPTIRHEHVLSPQEIAELKSVDTHLLSTESKSIRSNESQSTFDELEGMSVNKSTKRLLQLPSQTIEKNIPVNLEAILLNNLKYRLYEFEERRKARELQKNPDMWDSMVSVAMDGINLLTPEADRLLREAGFDQHLEIFRENLRSPEQVGSIADLERRLSQSLARAMTTFEKNHDWERLKQAHTLTNDDLQSIQEVVRGLSPTMLVEECKANLFGAESDENRARLLEFILKQKGGFALLLALPPEKGTIHGSRLLSLLDLKDEHPPKPSELQSIDWLVTEHLRDTIHWLAVAVEERNKLTPPESVLPSNPSQQ